MSYTIKFYADKEGSYKNRLFCFDSEDPIYLEVLIYCFVVGRNKIRAFFMSDHNAETNTRVDSQEITNIYENVRLGLMAGRPELVERLKLIEERKKQRKLIS